MLVGSEGGRDGGRGEVQLGLESSWPYVIMISQYHYFCTLFVIKNINKKVQLHI